jgi:transmembrane sensor
MSEHRPGADVDAEDCRDAAALWLAKRAGGSLSREEAAELDDWLNAAPANRQAFDEMRVLWARLEEPARRMAERRSAHPRFALPRFAPRAALIAAAGGAFACLGIWLLDPNILDDWRADVVSGRQIVSQVTLPDGSTARLAADTALAWDFDATQRHVTLLRGEAFFEVVPGSTPAFTVTSQGDRVRVVGTGFNVNQRSAGNTVTVAHGAVEVAGVREVASVRLAPGEGIAVDDGRTGKVEPADLDSALAWMSGRMVVQQESLGDVAAALGRYLPGRLIVRGGLSDRRVSGSFPLDDAAGSLETLAVAVGAHVLRMPMLTVIY